MKIKKNAKKILLSSMAIPAIIPVASAAHKNNNYTIKNNIKSINSKLNTNYLDNGDEITFNNNNYANIEDAVNDFLSQKGTVTQKLYLGDVNEATSANDYNTINLNKLKEVGSSNVVNAYKTLTDNYTSDLMEAKKSYLQNPVIKWVDNKNNEYDSESEARYAIQNNGDYYTSPIAYYEVKDFSRKDQYGLPTIVKINPLNKNDIDKLKEITARNMLLNNSDFSIDRLSVDSYKNESVYSITSGFKGKTNQEITNITNQLSLQIADIIKNNMLLNVKVNAVPDYPSKELWFQQNGKAHAESVNFSFNTNGWNPKSFVFANDIKNDAKYFVPQKGDWSQKFSFQYAPYANNGSYKPIQELISKNGQTVLGGQSLSFTLNNGQQIAKKYKAYMHGGVFDQYMLWQDDIGFMGRGKKVSGYFQFEINQKQFDDAFFNSSNVKNQLLSRSQTVKSQVDDFLNNKFKELGFSDDESRSLVQNIGQAASDILYKNIMNNTSLTSASISGDASQINKPLEQLNNIIVDKLNEQLKSKNQLTLSDTLRKYLSLKYQARDVKESNNDIYVATYNNAPLFQLDQSLVSDLFNNEYFKTNPLDAVKASLSKKLSNNYTDYLKTIISKMTNISNIYKVNNQKQFELTKNAIDSYEASSSYNFGLDQNTENPNGFDNSIKLFDNKIFDENNIKNSELEKQLNRREDDNVANLNNAFGTFEAVYQYNKTLKNILNDKNASDTLKNNVNKNAVKNVNDIVVLYDKSHQPQTIKYGEYLNYGYKFNESLSNNNIRVLNSIEKRKYEIGAENLDIPTKKYTYFDYNGNILLSENVNMINGSYDTAANQVYLNALNKIVVPASSNYVYYVNKDGSKELVKNKTTKLNVLTVTDNTGKTYQYGFTNFNDLQKYATDYIKGNINVDLPPIIDKPIFNRSVSSAMLNGFLTSLAIITIAEIIVMSYTFVKSNKNKNFSATFNKKYNF